MCKGVFTLIENECESDVTFSCVRTRIHQVSASTLRQLCGETSDIVIVNNEVAPEWGWNTFLSHSIVLNENKIASIIAELSQF